MAGKTSLDVDPTAYLATRMPATYAAVAEVLARLQGQIPDFSPASLLDLGCGPGTASWAAVERFDSLQQFVLLDQDERFLHISQQLMEYSSHPALKAARMVQGALQRPAAELASELVIAAYCFAELDVAHVQQAVSDIWPVVKNVLVVVEPGTPQGFARIRLLREQLLQMGSHLVAPCSHAGTCPMAGEDWCHFKVRLARSRQHLHAKQARVPYEDESFSYIIASRFPHSLTGQRILAPPEVNKAAIRFKLCAEAQPQYQAFQTRNKQVYKQVKKLRWGDLLTPQA